MEKGDLELIEQHVSEDPVLKALYDEHVGFERKLDKLNRKPFLNPKEESEKRDLQKKKLLGRDLIERILIKYRSQG